MKNKFFQFLILSIILLFIVQGEKSVLYAKEALELCYNMIIPTLFPFFICSGLLIYSGFCESMSKIFAPLMKPLFNINPNGSAAFILGIMSGYPLGAMTVCDLYEGFYISKSEAERMLSFCNNSGPLFILGAVGIGLYSGLWVGVALYAVHIISAVLVGVIMRFYKKNDFLAPKAKITVKENSPLAGFGSVLENSVRSILNVCGAVMFFSVVSRLCLDFISLEDKYMAIIGGIMEFASGTKNVALMDADFATKMILSAFIVGFAGLTVHIQVLATVSKHELSMKPYIFGKVLHGMISAALMWAVVKTETIIDFSKQVNLSGGFALGSIYLILTVVVIFTLGIIFLVKGKLKHNS